MLYVKSVIRKIITNGAKENLVVKDFEYMLPLCYLCVRWEGQLEIVSNF